MMYRLYWLFFVFLTTVSAVYADSAECKARHCVAVIDAGSSSSRLHVYAYDTDITGTPTRIKEVWNRKVVPGISTIEHEHSSVALYLEKLFTNAPVALMPVYFYSTAGMRLLPKTHHKNINQLVAEWFDRQYYWRLESARTITGSEEGVFAWLAMNYQLHAFDPDNAPLTGVLDIGGASTQIVFPVQNTNQIAATDLFEIALYGKKYTLFSHSFLGLGQNEMGHQYQDLRFCYPTDYELPSGLPGAGDANRCKEQISTLVNAVHGAKELIKPALETNHLEEWHIMGGITYFLNDKLLPFQNQTFTSQALLTFADQSICKQTWQTLETTYPDNFMLYNYCMLASYLYALLTEGYTLPSEQIIHFTALNKTADWTIGVVLQHKKK